MTLLRAPRTVARYRWLADAPKRGLCRPASATRDWIAAVRRRQSVLEPLGERAFSHATDGLRQRIRSPAEALAIPVAVESFALTAEALRRTCGLQYRDVQLLAGFALAGGTVAEVATGEGKTITAALPAVLHAWCGRGVHVATTNEYLSSRDHEQLRPLYQTLGLSVGHLAGQQDTEAKRRAYRCDITYGPGYQFGFDFLRDQLARRQQHRRQLGRQTLRRMQGRAEEASPLVGRDPAFAIIDEADSVMIDEATTPLVIAGEPGETEPGIESVHLARELAASLQAGVDFHVTPPQRIAFSTTGLQRLRWAGRALRRRRLARPWRTLVEQALRAERLLRRDVDYTVDGGRLVLVDPTTGRLHPERHFRQGLHQALEAKEGLPISQPQRSEARVSRQRFFGLYTALAGLTGTAIGCEAEFREGYHLPVVLIPTHQPCRRQWLPLRSFASREAKYRALANNAALRSGRGQPVLIGTGSIEETRRLAETLRAKGIEPAVLNGVQDASEAAVVAAAGRSGHVTVATHLAGRGTDIQPDAEALAAGGLHVIGAEVNGSRRVDRQLAGRAGRQGEPGSCQFYVSAEDDLVRHGCEALSRRMAADGDPAGVCRQDVTADIARLQKQAEREARHRRRHLVRHDDWYESFQASLARRD